MKRQALMGMIFFALCGMAFSSGQSQEVVLNRPVPVRASGRLLTKNLHRKVSASWRNVELRTIINRLAEEHRVSVVLDRTIDPTQKLSLDLAYQPLLAGFEVIAKSASARLCVLKNTVYIGPEKRAAQLRTLEAIRAQEPIAAEDQLPPGRVLEVTKRRTVHWNDLDEPRELVKSIAQAAKMAVINSEAIPHDLWATATLPQATVTEALSLVLIQFDLTFQWNQDASQIRLVPLPEHVVLEKAYQPAKTPSARSPRSVRERFLKNAARRLEIAHPGMKAVVDLENNCLVMQGTLEQHEALTGDKAPQPPPAAGKFPPINRRQFTLRIQRVPASALMRKLEQSGIQFSYDKDQLKAKNINLDQLIGMDVNKADSETFFKALFDPLKLDFEIDNLTITLTPQ